MEMLKQMIKERGELRPGGVVVVSGFLNHRMNTELIDDIGREFYRIFADEKPTLILTVEASGIGIACLTARYIGVDVLFAKKSQSKNLAGDTYSSLVRSFTRGTVFDVRVDKNYISANDRVLLIDDFLADGEALKGLIDITNQAGATVVGAGICIEKAFQPGGDRIRKMNINLHSLVRIGLDANGDMIILDQ